MSIVSFCVIILEVEEDGHLISSLTYKAEQYLEMSKSGKGLPVPLSTEDPGRIRGQRRPKNYEVTTYVTKTVPMEAEAEASSAMDPNSKGDTQAVETSTEFDVKHFISGNPFVEITKGIMHLYKDNDRYLMDKDISAGRSVMICILAVPATQSCIELLRFLAPLQRRTEHIQIIRDTTPNQYMVLLKFRNQDDADEFYVEFNGKKFNSFEDDICLLAYVSRVETVKGSNGGGLPLTGHTELPTCPVCLERMDESVDGLLTILCNHSFHSNCLAKWSDASCPVCRYIQTPEMVNKNVCVECKSSESLWICLICGHVGCGRYIHGHAYKHFCETQHNYALQPDNNRVWDYIGDNFVHRLLQNKGDGKMVEIAGRHLANPSGEDGAAIQEAEEKVDSMQLEFTYLLTTQLQSQRDYFEGRLEQVENDMRGRVDFLMSKLELVETDRQETETKLRSLQKEKTNLEKKLALANQKLSKSQAEMKEQREMAEGYSEDNKRWKKMLAEKEKKHEDYVKATTAEISDLKEQLRDVMFYFEAQNKIEESPYKDEMHGASVNVDESSVPSTSKSKTSAAARRRKR